MKLKSIRLRGFRGLRGLGVPEVNLDLSSLPEEGLVAVCGANGAGKTTLLDNLHPYRLQPFKCRKAKEWSPGAFSFYDQTFGSDACKELVFEMGGELYRSLVLIDAERRKQEAYLYRWLGGSWGALNDGKVKTYDEEVEKVCGSPSLFFTSVFRCQGAKNLSDYTRSSIMAIIAELLNIDHIKEQSEKCGKVVTALSAELASVRQQVAALLEEAGAATGLLDTISQRELALSSDRLGLGAARNDLDAVRHEIAGIRERIAAQVSEKERRVLVERQRSDERVRRDEAFAVVNEALAGIGRRLTSVKTEDASWLSQHDSRVGRTRQVAQGDLDTLARRRSSTSEAHAAWLPEMQAKIKRAEHIVSGADKVRGKLPEETTLQQCIAQDKNLLPKLEEERSAALFADNRHAEDLRVLKTRLENATTSAARLVGIDCSKENDGWVKPSCPLIAVAVTDRDSVAGLEARVAEHEANTFAHDALVKADADLAACKQSLAANEAALVEVQKFTRLLPELELAEANLESWRGEITQRAAQLESDLSAIDQERTTREAQLEEDLRSLGAMLEDHQRKVAADLQVLDAEKAQAEERWLKDAAAFDERILALSQEVAAFPPVGDDLEALLRAAEIKEASGGAAVEGFEARIRETELAIASLRTRLEAAQAKSAEAEALQPKVDRYVSVISRFSFLGRACSNDGVIALELDDAAPSITAIVNDLLRACYGSRFTVRMDTQTAKVNGDMKEDLDIIVFDAETGDERSITEMSGGQVTIIEDAITRAMCLFNIHRSDRVYGTLYSDERDGALDADRKLEFLRVKREALRVGTHNLEFFISQTPDLVDMADARIVLAPGGVRIT